MCKFCESFTHGYTDKYRGIKHLYSPIMDLSVEFYKKEDMKSCLRYCPFCGKVLKDGLHI